MFVRPGHHRLTTTWTRWSLIEPLILSSPFVSGLPEIGGWPNTESAIIHKSCPSKGLMGNRALKQMVIYNKKCGINLAP